MALPRNRLITPAIFVPIRSILAFFLGLDMKDVREEGGGEEKEAA